MPKLDFKGKRHIYAHHLTVPYRTLVPEPEKSVGDCRQHEHYLRGWNQDRIWPDFVAMSSNGDGKSFAEVTA
jgi:hypothetical protein